jgi:uncharacterized protein (DUF433 family)
MDGFIIVGQVGATLSISAAAWVLDISKADVDRVIDEGSLPAIVFPKRSGRRYVRWDGLAYVKFSFLERQRLYLRLRKEMLGKMLASRNFVWADDILKVDLTKLRTEIEGRVRRLRQAERIVVERPDILGGQPCLKGTRMPVYMVAAMKSAGATIDELVQSYPSLTPALIEGACVFASAHPKKGRPAEPVWWKSRQVTTVRVPKRRTAKK